MIIIIIINDDNDNNNAVKQVPGMTTVFYWPLSAFLVYLLPSRWPPSSRRPRPLIFMWPTKCNPSHSKTTTHFTSSVPQELADHSINMDATNWGERVVGREHHPMFAWVYDAIVMSFLLLFTSLSYFFGLWLYFYRRYLFPINLLTVCSL